MCRASTSGGRNLSCEPQLTVNGGMMELWMLLLLHLQLVAGAGVSLPAPSSVSISSFNLEHLLSFQPGPGVPPGTRFTVQVVHPRRSLWRPVAGCSELVAGQMCNLSQAFQDPHGLYQARVQAFTPTRRSSWTSSGWFQPLSDTVLGPPDVTVSGCGNCLVLQLGVPRAGGAQQNLQLKDLYKGVILHVQRTRDKAQFTLNLPYNEEVVITYLQRGVEYCVTVSVMAFFNSNGIPSKPYCALTSPPPSPSSLYVVFSLLAAFCMLGCILVGSAVHGGQLSLRLIKRCLPRPVVTDRALCAGT